MKRNPFLKVNDKTRADSIEKARKGGLEEEIDFGIEFGKRESAEKIREQDTTLIKEIKNQATYSRTWARGSAFMARRSMQGSKCNIDKRSHQCHHAQQPTAQ